MLELFILPPAIGLSRMEMNSTIDAWNRSCYSESAHLGPPKMFDTMNGFIPRTIPISVPLESMQIQMIGKVNKIRDLKQNWNGHDAQPIPEATLSVALDIATNIESSTGKVDVFPTGRQSIQFERTDELDNYFELEIFEDRIVFFSDDVDENGIITPNIMEAISLFQGKNG